MSGQGRPLRFLTVVLTGWTVLRVWALWPGPAPVPVRAVATRGVTITPGVEPKRAPISWLPTPSIELADPMRRTKLPPGGSRTVPQVLATPATAAEAGAPATPSSIPVPTVLAAPASAPPAAPTRATPSWALVPSSPSRATARLSGSAWLLLRDGPAAPGTLAVSQLGGSQAGVRLAYAIDSRRRLALSGWLSAPLHGTGREAVIGLAWRPTRAAVTVIAEQRLALDGGRGGPALGVVAGLNPTPVAAGLRIEAYGQAGAIRRDGFEGFADGAARLTRRVKAGPLRFDLGLGTWGGVQRDAARLDLGPSLALALPVAHARLTLDWRVRVGGHARPGSGPALSLGTDF